MMAKRDHHSSHFPGSPKIRQAMMSADKCLSSENYILHYSNTPYLQGIARGCSHAKNIQEGLSLEACIITFTTLEQMGSNS